MCVVYICDRKLTTSGILCHLVNFPQFCTGPQILRRVANSGQNSVHAESQNPDIPSHGTAVAVMQLSGSDEMGRVE